MNETTFRSETHPGPQGAIIEVGTVTFQGRDFQALGSVVDPSAGIILAYVSERERGKGQGPLYTLTTWNGATITTLRLVRRWTQRGFGGARNEIWAWSAVVDGVTYSGRNSGPGMAIRMRAGRKIGS